MIDIFDMASELIDKIPAVIKSSVLASITAFVRVSLDRKEVKCVRRIMEAGFCGLIALSLYYGIRALGLSDDWAVFFGGMVGWLGSDTIRAISKKWALKRVEKA